MKRDIITINTEKCTGCGSCISKCPEGALQVIDGKAKIVSDSFCDGLGACIGDCPEGAIEVQTRDAEPYDEGKVMENVAQAGDAVIQSHLQHLQKHGQKHVTQQAIDFLKEHDISVPDNTATETGSCPGPIAQRLGTDAPRDQTVGSATVRSELRNWPIQLQLLNVNTPVLKNSKLLLAADCVPFAFPGFHQQFLRDRVLIIFCPKLDTTIEAYVDKLSEIFQTQDIQSISVVHMEVPCCSGVGHVVRRALEKTQKHIPLEEHTISITGGVL